MLLFFIRHGDPIYDPDSLTPLGKRQAEAVSRRLALYGIDRVYASSSTRAIQTATPTSEVVKKEIQILDWCNESHAWRDLTVKYPDGRMTWCFFDPETRKKFLSDEIYRLGRRWYDHPDFAGNGFKPGMERISREADRFLKELGYVHDPEARLYTAAKPNEERITLFAHQGFGLAFLSHILDIPYPLFCTRFDLGHSSMTVIEFTERYGCVVPRVLTQSNDSHLYRDGLPTFYQNEIYF